MKMIGKLNSILQTVESFKNEIEEFRNEQEIEDLKIENGDLKRVNNIGHLSIRSHVAI